jgi:phospho-N-acetylmuramoyl-pentapeptide-transferase
MKGILLSGALSALFAFFATPLFIKFLTKKGYSQMIRDDGPTTHQLKRGTPTMGGIILIAATLIGYFLSHLITAVAPTTSALLVLGLIIGLGAVGFTDDWIKVRKQRSLGLNSIQKLIGQAFVAGCFAFAGLKFPDKTGLSPISEYLSTVRDTSIKLAIGLVIVWVILMVLGSSNGVNLTDGLDGLATGAALLSFVAYTVMSIWQYGQSCFWGEIPRCYTVRDPLDLAVFAAATAGACFGFLWWNSSPARIFMGDTGSLALGGGLAALALMTRTELLLGLIGGLFVLITLSVIAQVGSYKLTGRRVLRMAPLHHHFEMKGWPEVLIVVRFWIIQGLCVGAGMALFYAEWVRQ